MQAKISRAFGMHVWPNWVGLDPEMISGLGAGLIQGFDVGRDGRAIFRGQF